MTLAHHGVPEWNRQNSPRRSGAALARHHGLSVGERDVARDAAKAARAYREWYVTDEASGRREYPGETADALVERRLPDAGPRKVARVLDVACAWAQEGAPNFTSLPTGSDYRRTA